MPVEIHFKQLSMASMLHDLAIRHGVAVMADGVPALKAADLDYNGNLLGAVDRIADTFDYTVTTHKSGIISLLKRFTNPDERPQVVPAEIRQTAADMLTILPALRNNLGVQPTWVTMLRLLATQLPQEQVDAMKRGTALRIVDLSPDLRSKLVDIMNYRAYGVARSMWEQIYNQLDRFDNSVLRARKKGVFTSAEDGKSTTSYSVNHETKSPAGEIISTEIGTFQRRGNQ